LQNTGKTQEWSFDWSTGKTQESDERAKKIFQEVGALAKFPPKSTCNVSFHRNFIRFEKFQSFESKGQIGKFPIGFEYYEIPI
jgi:hypothetical protein